MRATLMKHDGGGEKYFRWRGTNISRVENLSDAVFGFAITLLVVSSAVPTTFADLKLLLGQFVPFGLCVAVFGMIWQAHYKFFRRYGLHDTPTMLINAVLLFVVLFYLYPLKFLTQLLYNVVMGRAASMAMTWGDSVDLLYIYSMGYAMVFGLLAALYYQAWRQRQALELNPVEELITQQALGLQLVHVIVALLAALLGKLTPWGGLCGGIYFLIGPCSYWVGSYYGRRIKALVNPPPPPPPPAPVAE